MPITRLREEQPRENLGWGLCAISRLLLDIKACGAGCGKSALLGKAECAVDWRGFLLFLTFTFKLYTNIHILLCLRLYIPIYINIYTHLPVGEWERSTTDRKESQRSRGENSPWERQERQVRDSWRGQSLWTPTEHWDRQQSGWNGRIMFTSSTELKTMIRTKERRKPQGTQRLWSLTASV